MQRGDPPKVIPQKPLSGKARPQGEPSELRAMDTVCSLCPQGTLLGPSSPVLSLLP